MSSSTPPDPLIGTIVSQYEIVAKLGGGGMGVVYRARDLKLGRHVALKFLPPQWSHDEGAKQRFVREAQAASATNHKNICTIHNIEETPDGRLFIVMAYYEGETLKHRLERGPLPVADAIEIAADIAEGLAKAHSQGVVHRDVKPGNVIVTDDGVKILDFGLAKFADSLQLTVPGSTIGTVAYMSPEQTRGEEADARSDVWALGVVLFEMLTGHAPFRGAYPEAIFYAIKHEPVPSLRALRPEIADPLERTVMRALEKDVEKRFQTAREPARELRLLQGRTMPLDLRTEPLPVPPGLKQAARARRARRWPVAAAVVLVLAAAAIGWTLWPRAPVARTPIAILPVANHTGDVELDAYRLTLTKALSDELRASSSIRIIPYERSLEILRGFAVGGRDPSSREALQALTARSGTKFVVVPALRLHDGAVTVAVELRSADTGTVAAAFQEAGMVSALLADGAYRLMPAVAALIQARVDEFQQRPSATLPSTRRLRTVEAARLYEQGLNAYERQEFGATKKALEGVIAIDSEHALARAWQSRASLLMWQNDAASAEGQAALRVLSADFPRRDALFVEAVAAESRRDLETAEARYRALVADHPDEPGARVELAAYLRRQPRGADKEAIELSHEVLRMDPSAIGQRVQLCWLYVRNGENPLAEEQARAARDAYRELRNSNGEAQALLCHADSLRAQGGTRLADARGDVERAQAAFAAEGDAYGRARAVQSLARIVATARDYRTSIALFEEALRDSRALGNRDLEGVTLMNLGVAHEAAADIARALEYYEQSRAFFQSVPDERRAAEQAVNIAQLRVVYGDGQDDALRRLVPAKALLERLGAVNFQVAALQAQAIDSLNAGRHNDGRRQLTEALSLARERNLGRVVELSTELAYSFMATGEYERARQTLDAIRGTDAGRSDLGARVARARLAIRLGDFETARTLLQNTVNEAEAGGQLRLVPTIQLASAEFADASGDRPAALARYADANARWVDEWPDAASVESRCSAAALGAELKRPGSHRLAAEQGVRHAERMRRVDLQHHCRLALTRIAHAQRAFAQAAAYLDGIALTNADGTFSPELQARAEFWRGRTLLAQGARDEAATHFAEARRRLESFAGTLPEGERDRLEARSDVAEILSTRGP